MRTSRGDPRTGGTYTDLRREIRATTALRNLDAVADRIIAFQDYLQTTATPFNWKFTRTEVHDLLVRIVTHQPLTGEA
jgi:hypothetical protein